MNIVLAAATRKEIEPVIRYLNERIYLRKHQSVDVVATGVGLMNATYALTRKFCRERPSLVIQAGIAGSFHSIYAPGMVVTVREEMAGDLGVLQQDQWQDVFDMGLDQENSPPWQEKKLVNPHKQLLKKLQLECVRGITVNQVSTDAEVIRRMREKYMPVVETMEGAALHYVCLKEGIPFLQIRAISNMVGERNKSKWKMAEAISSLNIELIKLLNQVTDPY
jgi:futalosine hydrolase